MSTFTAQPGTRLAGRYRLDDRVSETDGSTLWKAVDETLARPVSVRTFDPGFPRVNEVIRAARAASRMTDSRLAQVFDVEDGLSSDSGAFVVHEWVPGDGLDDLLGAGPMEANRAAGLVAQAADALSVAHAAGLAHLCLTPQSLRWAPGSGVKITGLGVDAALAAVSSDDPAAADTRGLGQLLYAALTAHWPGPPGGGTMLPRAPVIDGVPCSPRQVRAGVPALIDEITCEVLFGRPRRGQTPVTTPALLAEALTQAAPHAPLTPPPPPPRSSPGWPDATAALPQDAFSHASRTQYSDPYAPHHDPYGPRYGGAGTGRHAAGTSPHGMPQARRPVVGRAVAAVVIVLVMAAIGVGAWSLGRNLGSSPNHPRAGPSRGQGTTPVAATTVLKPVGAQAYGPNGGDNPGSASGALGGNPANPWHTDWYTSAEFGNLQPGTGVLLDMGKPVRLSDLAVSFGPATGADVSIKVGNSSVPYSPSALGDFTTVAQASGVGGNYTFNMTRHDSGRYVLIWFTKLPPGGPGGQFEAGIYNVVAHGSS